VGWLVVELTDSPFMLGLISFFRFAPMLLLSPFGGVLADRLNRVWLILIAQSSMAMSALVTGVLIAFGWIEVWHLVLGSLVIGMSFSINVPSRHALMADLVPRKDVANAVGLNNVSWSASGVVGPSMAGFLIGVSGIASAYFVQVAAYAWSVLNISRIKMTRSRALPRESMFTSLRQGYSYAVHSRPLLALILLALALALFGNPIVMLLAAFVKQDMTGGPKDLGLLTGAMGAGSLTGALVMVGWSRYPHKGRAVLLALLCYGLLLIGLGQSRSIVVAGALLALIGFCEAVYIANSITILQLMVPSEIRGRVISLWMASWGLMAVGILPMSAVAERFGTPLAMTTGGVLTSIVVLAVLWWNRELWNLRTEAEESMSEGVMATG
jgi:MFS family permease